MKPKIIVAPTHSAWVNQAVDLIVESADLSKKEGRRFSLALSGGSTPHPVYQALALPENEKRIDLSKTHIFWSDERCVPPDDTSSNYRMTRLALLDKLPVPAENIHRIHGENPPEQAAAEYQTEIDTFFTGQDPVFDLVLLGMGNDGHTASLFPGTDALQEVDRWVAANYVPFQQAWRITFTFPLLALARKLLFLVSGAGKDEMIKQVIEDPLAAEQYPAARAAVLNPDTTWLLDAASANQLSILEK
jgi:6-phosphogluconolactonase